MNKNALHPFFEIIDFLNNYACDKLGQLTQDLAEGLATIEWYKGGKKIKKITRSAANPTADKLGFCL